MDIDSEAQKDLALDDEDAEGVTGGIETTRKSTKRHHGKSPAPHVTAPRMIVQTAVYGTPIASANSGDDDCAPGSGGDPGSQDGSS